MLHIHGQQARQTQTQLQAQLLLIRNDQLLMFPTFSLQPVDQFRPLSEWSKRNSLNA